MRRIVAISKDVPSTWQEALDQFILFKQAQGVSTETVAGYRRGISQFFRRNPEAWKPERLKPIVLAHMVERTKPATFNLRLTYLRAFLDWCVREGILAPHFREHYECGSSRRTAQQHRAPPTRFRHRVHHEPPDQGRDGMVHLTT